jgi:hypothetical protein
VARRLVGQHPPPALLHELDQPVERIERELHTERLYEQTFVCRTGYRAALSAALRAVYAGFAA